MDSIGIPECPPARPRRTVQRIGKRRVKRYPRRASPPMCPDLGFRYTQPRSSSPVAISESMRAGPQTYTSIIRAYSSRGATTGVACGVPEGQVPRLSPSMCRSPSPRTGTFILRRNFFQSDRRGSKLGPVHSLHPQTLEWPLSLNFILR
jgi:hypothetical protein